ncbi:hypothetical protein J0670_37625, partial [Streptomyces sp. FH025]|nr:hypothetical protein [Streptomyces sp. FH025]
MDPTEWIDPLIGPLTLAPGTALDAWTGGPGPRRERAREVDGHLGLLDVGGAAAERRRNGGTGARRGVDADRLSAGTAAAGA